MIVIEPRIRNNICITAHPQGCAAQVRAQIHYVKSKGFLKSPARVLVIGASNGYGLAARIVSAFGSGAATIGIAYERSGSADRSATAGWYNNEAFKHEAKRADIPAWNINGDAFSEEVKRETMGRIKSDIGEVDFVVYSIAAPRRIDPVTGDIYSTVINPIGGPFTARGIDVRTGKITEMTAETATEEEVSHTVKVMGGEDWKALTINPGIAEAYYYMGRSHYEQGNYSQAKECFDKAAARGYTIDPKTADLLKSGS